MQGFKRGLQFTLCKIYKMYDLGLTPHLQAPLTLQFTARQAAVITDILGRRPV